MLDVADAAWLAGLIDGEGTFALTHGGDKRSPNLRLAIVSTSEPILEKSRRILRDADIASYERIDARDERWTPCSNIIIGTEGVLRLYDSLRPYLTRQVDRLDAAVAFLRPRYQGRQRVRWQEVDLAEWAELRATYNKR